MMEWGHEAVRSDFVARRLQRADDAEERLSWSLADRQAFTNDRLGACLEFARKRSRWHRCRLEGVDLWTVTPQDMLSLPTMNKRDLHDNWDTIVTDLDMSLAAAGRHLDTLKNDGFSFALGRYVVSATGGSTGFPAVIATDIDGFAATKRPTSHMRRRRGCRSRR